MKCTRVLMKADLRTESENLKKIFPKYMTLWTSNVTVFAKTEKGVEKLF